MPMSHIHVGGSDGKPIAIDYRYDETISPQAVLIFCHGYKGFKDWGTWNLMADEFMRAGFAVIKFNFSHNGIGDGDFLTFSDLEGFGRNTYSKELFDTAEVIAWTSKQGRFKDLPIVLMGHSRGGGISLLEGARNHKVQALITLAAVCDFGDRFPLGKAFEAWEKQGVFYVKNGRTGQEMPHYFSFYEDYKKHQDQLDIRETLRHFSKPLLALHTMDDEAVHVSAGMKLKKWNSNTELHLYESGGHTFGSVHPWASSTLPPAMLRVVEDVKSFLSLNL
jgi:pimeloyl-ACP methyl ester carboxylesterase